MADLKQSIQQFTDDASTLSQIVNGPADGPSSSVPTQGGSVPTLANVAARYAGVLPQAEAARDAAILNSATYPDEPTGRAAVADGEYFRVAGSGDSAMLLYRRTSSAASALVTAFPSIQALEAPARNARLGRTMFTVDPTFVTYSRAGTSITVGWTALRMLKGDSAIRKINDQAAITLTANECLYIDVTTDVGAAGSFAVTKGSFTALGADFVNGNKILLVNNNYGYPFGELATAFINRRTIDEASYPQDEIVAVKSTNNLLIYMKGSGGKYLKYQMIRRTNTDIRADIWHWEQVWETSRNGDTFTDVRRIVTFGENENAIKQTGKADFMGGNAHGDEQLTSVHCFIDGVETDLSTSGTIKCRRIEFLQKSNFLEEGVTPANIVGTSNKRWIFEHNTVTIRNYIQWMQSINLDQTFLAMLALLRSDASGAISTAGYRSPAFEQEDISAAGFAMVYTDADTARASGPNYSAEVRITRGWDKPGRKFNFSNSASYNKFYFDFTGSDYQTHAGEVMDAEAVFTVNAV